MTNHWDLTDLYNGFDDLFETDKAKLEVLILAYIDETKTINDGNVIQKIEAVIEIQESMTKLVKNLFSFCSLTLSTDVNNEEAQSQLTKIQSILTKTKKPDVLFMRALQGIAIETLSSKSAILGDYHYYLLRQKDAAEQLLTDEEEVLYAKLGIVASSAWGQMQSKLVSNLTVIMEGNAPLPISYVRSLAHSEDSSVRKEAYFKELDAYEHIADASAMALSNIKREVNIMNQLRGYQSPLEPTLKASRMSQATLDAMIEAMKQSVPDFERYLHAKASLLGHERGLPFYDLFAPIGEQNKTYTFEEAKQLVLDSFTSFNPKLGNFAQKAFKNRWIDVEPKQGKRGGAFCNNLQHLNQSRILLNFSNTLSDVTTLAHELGHGYHGEVIAAERPLNWSYPMPLAETASILAETIVMKRLYLDALTNQEKMSILEMSLQTDTQVIIDILSRFLFEHKVFLGTEDGTASKDTLKRWMIEAQKEAYGSGLDHNLLHPYMWLNKPHYYSAGLNFYNFPYAFGLLFGKGLYALYEEDKETFLKQYDQMLAITGKCSVEDVAATMGIDVTQSSFWEKSLKTIKSDIDAFIELTKK